VQNETFVQHEKMLQKLTCSARKDAVTLA